MATPTDENTRQFMIYAPDNLVRVVKIAAAQRGMTTSALVRKILLDWVETQDPEAAQQLATVRIASFP
jgi:plasmid stability protein